MIYAQVIVCAGSRCKINDSLEIRKEIEKELESFGKKEEVFVFTTGCCGMCQEGPIVKIFSKYIGVINYFKVLPSDAKRIVEETLINNKIIEEMTIRKR